MKIWLDAQLSPFMADWIKNTFNIEAVALRELGLRDATDKEIFNRAKAENVIVITKDVDFKLLQDRFGSPPKIIWLTCGNTSNKRLQVILKKHLNESLSMLASGESIVEIRD